MSARVSQTQARSVRAAADHLWMEALVRLVAWLGVVLAASVATAVLVGMLFGSR